MSTPRDCQTLRRFLREHGTLNLATGEIVMTHEEWVTGPCGVPLFGAAVCKGCATGWTHPENFPVTSERDY